ncbi:TetR/AcrR family transcriptional regulator [Pimelobacter simplex]|uniref:TetR/AcrR family transcriptional regulator n=1 Tax=Nocardioides simplex TaxID=2045 RepID=A0A7J5E4H5_NOCSI|nr:TetR/AcrR family transcriptional regulator [Pimelobacter simplex]KAB2812977.1 TetR/AcrR family transcriptional regulator [Pimelobacter simplex]
MSARPVSARRRQILDAAAPLFAEHGVAATSVRDIASAADLKSGSLYHQFAAKEEIAGEIVAAYVDELATAYDVEVAAGATGAERVVGLIRASLRVMHRHPHATQIYERDAALLREAGTPPRLREITNGLQESWLASLRDGMADGSVRAGLDVRVAFRLIRDGLWLTVRWYEPSEVYPLERLEEECIALYLAGIRA